VLWTKFTSPGWQFSGRAIAEGKPGDTGAAYQGAIAVGPGVGLYQLIEQGLVVEFTANGTKYYADDEMN
jgi:hypothetical protein